MELKQQLNQSLSSTIEIGSDVTEANSVKIFVRDWYLWVWQQMPSFKHRLVPGDHRDGMVKYQW